MRLPAARAARSLLRGPGHGWHPDLRRLCQQPVPGRPSGQRCGGAAVPAHKGTGTQSFNPKTCLLKANLKGTYKLGSGTGAYAHISGSGTYQLSILAVGAKSGGTCSKTLPPPTFQQVIRASGPVSLR
jgi:hypothetical protein